MDEHQQHGPSGVADTAAGEDQLVAARVALDEVLELPLDRRAEVFEQVHATVVAELRRLELG